MFRFSSPLQCNRDRLQGVEVPVGLSKSGRALATIRVIGSRINKGMKVKHWGEQMETMLYDTDRADTRQHWKDLPESDKLKLENAMLGDIVFARNNAGRRGPREISLEVYQPPAKRIRSKTPPAPRIQPGQVDAASVSADLEKRFGEMAGEGWLKCWQTRMEKSLEGGGSAAHA